MSVAAIAPAVMATGGDTKASAMCMFFKFYMVKGRECQWNAILSLLS